MPRRSFVAVAPAVFCCGCSGSLLLWMLRRSFVMDAQAVFSLMKAFPGCNVIKDLKLSIN